MLLYLSISSILIYLCVQICKEYFRGINGGCSLLDKEAFEPGWRKGAKNQWHITKKIVTYVQSFATARGTTWEPAAQLLKTMAETSPVRFDTRNKYFEWIGVNGQGTLAAVAGSPTLPLRSKKTVQVCGSGLGG